MRRTPMILGRAIAVVVLVWACAEVAGAGGRGQPAAPKPQPAPGGQAASPGAGQPAQPAAPVAPAEAYSYNPEGRRDPFVSLLNRGEDFRAGGTRGQRPEGLRGLLISEVTLRGLVKSQGGFVAILQGPDNRTYIVRPNDRLFDGTVRTITAEGVVFLQEVNDPLSLVKQREVRKLLRAPQEGR
jgi:Tfp pilus assembly protein PilP